MKSELGAITAVFLTCYLSGCSTIAKGSRQDVEVKTNPPGLQARINTQQCITPCTLKSISRKTATEVVITYKGVEKPYALDRSFNFASTIIGNIWNEVWIGLIVDSVSGASFDIENVDLDLEPKQLSMAPPTQQSNLPKR
jgi:hypothetical protein